MECFVLCSERGLFATHSLLIGYLGALRLELPKFFFIDKCPRNGGGGSGHHPKKGGLNMTVEINPFCFCCDVEESQEKAVTLFYLKHIKVIAVDFE